MENIIEKKFVLEYIKDYLNTVSLSSTKEIENARYYHNTSYCNVASIITNGILSLEELNKFKIRDDSESFLKTMSDIDSHINGVDSISLSVVGLTNLYKDEFEYDPFCKNSVGFVITSDIKAYRTASHYGNEFLAKGIISNDKFRAIDIRLLKLIEQLEKDYNINSYLYVSYEDVITRFNELRGIAKAIIKSNLDVPFREMSYDNRELDIAKLANAPKLVLEPKSIKKVC